MNAQQPTESTLKTGSQCLAALSILHILNPRPKSTYPSKSWTQRLPCIKQQRIQQATTDALPTSPLTSEKSALPAPSSPEKESTVLYLAYGSNLCAETFQGKRGIQPLAATNVVVPALTMTFDLPGLPYAEPCFANTAHRDTTTPPPYSSSPPTTSTTPSVPNPPRTHNHPLPLPQPTWPHGLVGVVYEITPADYAHIIATEGGGASYLDITIPCHALVAHTPSVPSTPTTAPFLAHTLFAPSLPPPSSPTSAGGLPRPSPPLAQPSARYLALLRAGAAEHGLPRDYAAYLAALRPYTATTPRQRLGGFVFLAVWGPVVLFLLGLAGVYAGEGGRSPRWLVWLTGRVFAGLWGSYDALFRGLFGEGEWTVEEGEEEEEGWSEKGALLGVGGRGDGA
ncbi:hypothetical protein MMC11_004548 [Xylographa trunciseda]|nr:hypothetical protein [Xylographa trunciseda]